MAYTALIMANYGSSSMYTDSKLQKIYFCPQWCSKGSQGPLGISCKGPLVIRLSYCSGLEPCTQLSHQNNQPQRKDAKGSFKVPGPQFLN